MWQTVSQAKKIGKYEIALLMKYKYLGHEISIARDNQTTELQRTISLLWVVFRTLSEVFKGIQRQLTKPSKKKDLRLVRSPRVMTYGAETLPLIHKTSIKFKVTQRGIKTALLGLTIRDRVRKEKITSRTGITNILEKIGWLQCNLARHMARMNAGRWTRTIIDWKPWVETDVLQAAQDRQGWNVQEEAYIQQWLQSTAWWW